MKVTEFTEPRMATTFRIPTQYNKKVTSTLQDAVIAQYGNRCLAVPFL
jgi:hypothetical protein